MEGNRLHLELYVSIHKPVQGRIKPWHHNESADHVGRENTTFDLI